MINQLRFHKLLPPPRPLRLSLRGHNFLLSPDSQTISRNYILHSTILLLSKVDEVGEINALICSVVNRRTNPDTIFHDKCDLSLMTARFHFCIVAIGQWCFPVLPNKLRSRCDEFPVVVTSQFEDWIFGICRVDIGMGGVLRFNHCPQLLPLWVVHPYPSIYSLINLHYLSQILLKCWVAIRLP